MLDRDAQRPSSAMICIAALSGETVAIFDPSSEPLATAAAHGLTVRAVKSCLQKEIGFSRFRQRLLCDKELMDESILQPPSHLQLVLLDFREASEHMDAFFLSACAGNRLNLVESMLSKPQNPNTTDREGSTGLHWAVREGHMAIARILLEASVDPNHSDSAGVTALHLASRKGDMDWVP